MAVEIQTSNCCASWYDTHTVTGSTGEEYSVSVDGPEREARCTCPGFKYHGTCKHLNKAIEDLCGWHPQWSDEYQDDPKVCPRCKGPTVGIRIAV